MTILKRLKPSPEVTCPECGGQAGSHESWCPRR